MGSLRPLPGGTGCILTEHRRTSRVLLRNTTWTCAARQGSVCGHWQPLSRAELRVRVQDAPIRSTAQPSSSPSPFHPQPQTTGRALPMGTALHRAGLSPPSHRVCCAPFPTIACGTRPVAPHFIPVPSLRASCLSPRPLCSSSLLGSRSPAFPDLDKVPHTL